VVCVVIGFSSLFLNIMKRSSPASSRKKRVREKLTFLSSKRLIFSIINWKISDFVVFPVLREQY